MSMMNSNTSQRPLKCRFCWVCFKYEQTLVEHIRRTHTDALKTILYYKYLNKVAQNIARQQQLTKLIKRNETLMKINKKSITNSNTAEQAAAPKITKRKSVIRFADHAKI